MGDRSRFLNMNGQNYRQIGFTSGIPKTNKVYGIRRNGDLQVADLVEITAGGSGTDNYEELEKLPEINGVTLKGDVTLDEINAASKDELKSNFIEYDNGEFKTVQEALDSLLYVKPAINSFTGGGTYEIGTVISTVNLAWSINKKINTQTLKRGSTEVSQINSEIRSYVDNININSNTTYTLSISDGKNSTSKTTSVLFKQKRYWGVSEKETLANEDILKLSQELTDNRKQTRAFNCSGGKYFWLAIPKQMCSGITFKVGGLAFSAMVATEIEFTNASGYTSIYIMYRPQDIQTGSNISVEVL